MIGAKGVGCLILILSLSFLVAAQTPAAKSAAVVRREQAIRELEGTYARAVKQQQVAALELGAEPGVKNTTTPVAQCL